MNKEDLRNQLALLLIEAGIEGISGFLNELMPEIERRPTFDEEGFLKWFKDKNVPFMAKPFGFMRKCIIPDIRNAKYDRQEQKQSDEDIRKILDKRRFIITEKWTDRIIVRNDDDDMRIDVALNWLWQCTDSDIDEIRSLNQSILDWLESRQRLSSKDYIWALKNSKYFKSKGGTEEIVEKRYEDLKKDMGEFERNFLEYEKPQ